MPRFKQLWSSFWRKDQGLGMIEMALLLPIFLIFAFAVIDFGNYLIVKNRIVSANQAIASAIQNNPTMTTGEWGSSSDLEKVIQNSLGDLWFKDGVYIQYTGVAVWTSTTPPSLSTAPSEQDGWLIRDIKNPWLSDADPSNDSNPYYVGVRVWRGVPFLTPLPKLLGFADGVTPGFDDSDHSREWGASNGRKVANSFTFVTLNDTTCPAGQVLERMTGRTPTCVDKDRAGTDCEVGKVVTGVKYGTPTCSAVPLNGVTTKHKDDQGWSKPEKTWLCQDGYYIIGVDCDGKCNSNNMRFRCAQIQLVNP